MAVKASTSTSVKRARSSTSESTSAACGKTTESVSGQCSPSAAAALLYLVALRHTAAALGTVYTVQDPPVAFAGDDAERARGAHLYAVLGCVEHDLAARVGPLGHVLYLFGKLHLVPAESIDHTPRPRVAPPEGATAAYGADLAHVCTGCHGDGLAGQRVPGTPPELPPAANLTPHDDGLKTWSQADFLRVLREGVRPDGSAVHPFRPWQTYGKMSDVELEAIWLHLRSLPAVPDR